MTLQRHAWAPWSCNGQGGPGGSLLVQNTPGQPPRGCVSPRAPPRGHTRRHRGPRGQQLQRTAACPGSSPVPRAVAVGRTHGARGRLQARPRQATRCQEGTGWQGGAAVPHRWGGLAQPDAGTTDADRRAGQWGRGRGRGQQLAGATLCRAPGGGESYSAGPGNTRGPRAARTGTRSGGNGRRRAQAAAAAGRAAHTWGHRDLWTQGHIDEPTGTRTEPTGTRADAARPRGGPARVPGRSPWCPRPAADAATWKPAWGGVGAQPEPQTTCTVAQGAPGRTEHTGVLL